MTPVVAIMLMLAVTAVLGAGVVHLSQQYTQDEFHAEPRLGILVYPDRGEAEVVQASWTEGTLVWEDLGVTGCDATGLAGEVLGGDTLADCSGLIRIIHIPTGAIAFSHQMHG